MLSCNRQYIEHFLSSLPPSRSPFRLRQFLSISAPYGPEVVIGHGTRDFHGRLTVVRAFFQPAAERLEDGAYEASGGDHRSGNGRCAWGRLQRLADLLGVLPQYRAPHPLQARAQAGRLDDEDARISRIVGQKQK